MSEYSIVVKEEKSSSTYYVGAVVALFLSLGSGNGLVLGVIHFFFSWWYVAYKLISLFAN